MDRPLSHFVRQLDPDLPRHGQPEILAELRRAITGGSVLPGSPIYPDEVARFFAVSPIPVREALKTLIGEGLVTRSGPRAGYAVAQLTPSEYEELYIVCRALELAALVRALDRAGDDDDARLLAAHDASARALAAGDVMSYQHATKDFHFALTAPAAMPRLTSILEHTWHMTEPGQPMRHNDAERRARLQREHTAQVQAFLARDLAALVSATEDHYRTLFSVIGELPPSTGVFRDR